MKRLLNDRITRGFKASTLSASAILVMAGCLSEIGDSSDPEGSLGESQQDVIYGDDDRTDVFDHSDANLRRLTELSTATLIESRFVNISNPSNVTFPSNLRLKNSFGVDDAEFRVNPNAPGRPICQTPAPRFADDVAAGFCTGTLIDDDLLLTAGHCVPDPRVACGVNGAGTARFVFNYRNDAPATLHTITTADVFSCTQAMVFRNDPTASGNLANDYAIVKLDRVATPRFTPAPVRTTMAPLAAGLKVGTMGSGIGLPHKIDSGGTVTNPGTISTTFLTAMDIFGGASGSGVYELGSYQLSGIVVRSLGFMAGPPGSLPAGCVVPTVCSNDASCADPARSAVGGNIIGYVGVALADFCASNPGNARLCGSHRNAFAFSASNTSSASQNTINHFVYLEDGATIDATTCSTVNPGASGVGDTVLNLASPADPLLLTEIVALNDDDAADNCGVLSRLTFTVPAMRGGLYRLQAGCFDAGNCSGTVAYTVTGPGGGSFSYDAANTANGTVNTRDLDISVQAGNVVTVGTCSPTAALGVQEGVPAPLTLERPAFSGDTIISLVSGATVVTNDDACGTIGSQLKFTATATGTVKLRAGCFGSTSCSGTVSYTINRDTVFYARSNTNSGTVNTLATNVALRVGDQITVGTCGLLGSAFTGDTVLSLFSGATRLEVSDDGCASGRGSFFTHRAAATGTFQVRSGCFSNGICTATPVIRVTPAAVLRNGSGAFLYGAGSTNNATRDTTNQFLYLLEGQQVKVTTCNVGTAGDTVLRAFGPNSRQVAFSDDDATCAIAGVGTLASTLTISVGPGQEGSYEIRGGCFGDQVCQGTTSFQSL